MTLIVVAMVFVLGLGGMIIIGRANLSLKHDSTEVGLIAAENPKPAAPVVTPAALTATTP